MNKDFGIFLSLRRVTVVALSLVSLSAAWATPPKPRDANETSIRALHSQMIEAYNRGDAAGAASTFAPEGTLITGDATRYVTPLEIERYLSRLLAKLPQGTRFMATVTDVRVVGRDIMVLTSEGGWLYPGEIAVSDKNQGIQTLVALRHKGVWRTALFQRTRKPIWSNCKVAKTWLMKPVRQSTLRVARSWERPSLFWASLTLRSVVLKVSQIVSRVPLQSSP